MSNSIKIAVSKTNRLQRLTLQYFQTNEQIIEREKLGQKVSAQKCQLSYIRKQIKSIKW